MSIQIKRVLAAAIVLASGKAAGAQGTLSTLGFGYPTGQFSTRALGTAGASGEIDPLSASNPATISYFGGSVLYFQAEPEYRTLNVGAASEKTSIARYPMVVAAFPVRPGMMMGLTVSNLLDRSFETESRGTTRVADSLLNVTNAFKSDGAIADLRVALSWSATEWLKVGGGVHSIVGDNRIRTSQVFDDSTRFATLTDTATVGYTGSAFSLGAELTAIKDFSITGAYRRGNSLSLKRGDTTITKANVPDHVAFSVVYLGIRGSSLAVRTAKETWSNMRGLGSSTLRITDAWDTSVGADVLGPRVGGRSFQVRGGYRWRTLPFGLAASSVSERTASFGLGTIASRGRSAFDFAALRATRSVNSSTLSEKAWTFSFGITVRP